MTAPLKKPRPDIGAFTRSILGKEKPRKVHLAELHLDCEIIKAIVEGPLGGSWVAPTADERQQQSAALKMYIDCWHRLGYDYVRHMQEFLFGTAPRFAVKTRETENTSALASGARSWTEEGTAVIRSWEDYERYPWPRLEDMDLWAYEFTSRNLPEGMGFFACPTGGFLEMPVNALFGYENLCYLMYDVPDLVKAVFDRVGELIYGYYRAVVGMNGLAGFFQGDDMGFKTGTLVSPDFLREYVLPWHKKVAALAHEHGLLYMLHSCGDLECIMDELIDDVKIDARHSFEDTIMPVGDFQKRYEGRLGVLGGVDIDKLCRLDEKELRRYVRAILDECMPRGRYALGTGNSVADYVPVENYLVMLDEGLRWEEENM